MQRYHIIIDAQNVSQERLNDKEGITAFLNKLPGLIDMKILVPPTVVQGIPENPGITGFVIIDFSHISIHTFTAKDLAMVDIFSCKPYDQDVAIQAVLDFFQVKKEDTTIKEVWWG